MWYLIIGWSSEGFPAAGDQQSITGTDSSVQQGKIPPEHGKWGAVGTGITFKGLRRFLK